jgi:hypothetical protein
MRRQRCDAGIGECHSLHRRPIHADLQGNVLWYYQPTGGTSGDIVQPLKQLANSYYIVTYSPLSTWIFNTPTLTTDTLNETMEVDLGGNVIKSIDVATLNTKLQSGC